MSNAKDPYIQAFQFDLFHLSEKSHHHTEDRCVKIFDQSLRRTTQNLFTKYAENEEIFLEKLELDLGELYQEDLEQQLPLAFEKALEEQLNQYFKNVYPTLKKQKDKTLVKSISSSVFYYLNYGFFPWYYQEKESFLTLWGRKLPYQNFITEAFQHPWKTNEINRLSLHLIEPYWQKTLQAFVPQQVEFISTYQQEVIKVQEEISLKSLSKYRLSFLVKKFILTYIFMTRGSFFSKKQFLENQLQQIANHYHIEYKTLVELFINHIKNIPQQSFLQQELYMLLCSMREDILTPVFAEKSQQKNLQLHEIECYLEAPSSNRKIENQHLKNSLFSYRLRQKIKLQWLSPLQEKKLYQLLQVNIGETTTLQIKKYHQLLYKQRELIEEKPPETNFKKAVWEFTLDYFSYSFSSYFQLKSFIIYHTKAISNQYNLSYTQFLTTLIYCAESFFSSASSQLELLYVIKQLSQTSLFIKKPANKEKYSTILEKIVNITREKGKITAEEILKQIQLLSKNQSSIEVIYLLIEELNTSKKVEPSTAKLPLKELNVLLQKLTLQSFPELSFTDQLVILSSATSTELKQLKNHQLSFYTFKKILHHESFLSIETIKNVQKVFQQKEIKTQFFEKWMFTLTTVEQENFMKIFTPHHRFLIEVWQLLSTEFPLPQYKKLYEYFFSEFILIGFRETPSSFWKNQLPKIASQLGLSSVELRERLLQKSFYHSSYPQRFYQHFLFLSRLTDTSPTSFPTLAALKILKKFFPKGKFLTEGKKDWKTLVISLKKLTELPYQELWEKRLFIDFSKTDFRKTIPHLPKEFLYLLQVLQQRYQLEQTWKKFNKIYRLNSFELFLLTMVTKEELEKIKFQFTSISSQELKPWTQVLLMQKDYFEVWLNRPTSTKKQLFDTAFIENATVLKEFYIGLEKIYAALPANERPHRFQLFEAHFWKVLFYAIQKKEPQAWTIIINWLASLKLQHPADFILKIEKVGFQFCRQQEWKNWKEIQQKNTDKALEISAEEEVKEELPEGRWEMTNTGLVILHPFLKQLFTGLGYVLPTGKFKSTTEKQRAVLLLHFLATGKTISEEEEIDEGEFTFPKILCGFPVTEVIVPSALTEKEMAIATDLLKACLMHWEKLKNSSIRSLRYTFLQRKGFVEKVENAYQLTVEKSGTDILLDSLPWSFSMIKLPWLKETIFSSWR